MSLYTFTCEFRLINKGRHSLQKIKKAYAAYRLLGCKIKDIPKEWYK